MVKHYRPPGKKKEGNAARYITRSQAVKHLQVTLPLFRRLCILKGVFPREPKKKVKGNHHTYYHVKDIAFLQHEPLLEIFRDKRAYEKKIKKAESKKNPDLANRLRTRIPTYTLDRIIRERYPKFVDALRDLDDCLTMVHLFAALPALEREKLEVDRVHNCRRLSHEWQAYISRVHKLRKVFISVKGIYYQAEVEGQKVTWLTPHALQQVLPEDDVDFNVMLTFLEVYETLVTFVNFHLYHSINVKYPPILDPRLEALASDLYALSRYFDANSRTSMVDPQASNTSGSEQVEAQQKGTPPDESELRLAQLQHHLPSNEPGALMRLVEDVAGEDEEDEDTRECKKLFKNLKFFLSREVPRESLLFVIPAFGGVVSWEGEGAPFNEADQSITHQIVDRPTQGHKFLSREYVQPQWVYDCVNARIILPTENYMVGRVPPPHLSPFVDNEAEGYVPEYAETIKRLQAAGRNEVLPLPGVGKEDLEDPQKLLVEGIIDRAEANEAAERKRKMILEQNRYLDELKMEVDGVRSSSTVPDNKQTSKVKKAGEESDPDIQRVVQDHANMSKVVMSRNKRKLYEAMEIGKKRKQAHVDLLKERKRKIEGAKKSGET
ncbi:pescadillo homolog [Juglans microcarpa x Juglans regia]|uniref:pescadillo homolog n=1 Tax=Juglans microcarpa x Juglans regia TaxID=2249226 RepID=UPI001B7F1513|nr:pescadillo homolog [Juglans microcarpa x Juglans regia]